MSSINQYINIWHQNMELIVAIKSSYPIYNCKKSEE